MVDARTIPCLLLSNGGLYKTTRFAEPVYLGDPINIVRIFNEKEVDELCLLDIEACKSGRPPDFDVIREIVSECFMPVSYGGGISTLDHCARLISSGIEKLVINSALGERPEFALEVANMFGRQSVVASIDVRAGPDGRYSVWTHGATRDTGVDPVGYASRLERFGVGEILLNAVDRDGTREGYDLALVRSVSSAVQVPVIACGGASSLDDLAAVIVDGHATAAAAGSLFVFYGRRRAVLINPPTYDEFQAAVAERWHARNGCA